MRTKNLTITSKTPLFQTAKCVTVQTNTEASVPFMTIRSCLIYMESHLNHLHKRMFLPLCRPIKCHPTWPIQIQVKIFEKTSTISQRGMSIKFILELRHVIFHPDQASFILDLPTHHSNNRDMEDMQVNMSVTDPVLQPYAIAKKSCEITRWTDTRELKRSMIMSWNLTFETTSTEANSTPRRVKMYWRNSRNFHIWGMGVGVDQTWSDTVSAWLHMMYSPSMLLLTMLSRKHRNSRTRKLTKCYVWKIASLHSHNGPCRSSLPRKSTALYAFVSSTGSWMNVKDA